MGRHHSAASDRHLEEERTVRFLDSLASEIGVKRAIATRIGLKVYSPTRARQGW